MQQATQRRIWRRPPFVHFSSGLSSRVMVYGLLTCNHDRLNRQTYVDAILLCEVRVPRSGSLQRESIASGCVVSGANQANSVLDLLLGGGVSRCHPLKLVFMATLQPVLLWEAKPRHFSDISHPSFCSDTKSHQHISTNRPGQTQQGRALVARTAPSCP